MNKPKKILNIFITVDIILNAVLLSWGGKIIFSIINKERYIYLSIPILITGLSLMFFIFQVIYLFQKVILKNYNEYSSGRIMSIFSIGLKLFLIVIWGICMIAGVNMFEMLREVFSGI